MICSRKLVDVIMLGPWMLWRTNEVSVWDAIRVGPYGCTWANRHLLGLVTRLLPQSLEGILTLPLNP